MAAAAEMLLQDIALKDDLAVKLGDALDVKASIGLVVITFLATQSAYFLDKQSLPHGGRLFQFASIISVTVAGILALMELWPRTYMIPEPEGGAIEERIEQLADFYGEAANSESISDQLTRDEIQWAKNRIMTNQRHNRNKAYTLAWSFRFTAASLVLNLLTLTAFILRLS